MDKTTTGVRRSFSPLVSNLQLAWDSTSLSALKTCPRYYQYNIIEGYVSNSENVHFRFGSEYNNALVTYNKYRVSGKSHEESQREAVRYAMLSTWDEKLNRPWTSDMPEKNRETLIRSIIWYLEKFENDPFQTFVQQNGEASVEQSFAFYIDVNSGISNEPYMFCGYLDRRVFSPDIPEMGGWITDWKTTKTMLNEKYFENYSPNNQISLYSFAARIIGYENIQGVIIDAAQLGVNFSRFERRQINRNPAQLEEWFQDSLFYIRQNEIYVEQNYWPMNDTSCGMYGGCAYRKICSLVPGLRQRYLDTTFSKRKWDPLVVREI